MSKVPRYSRVDVERELPKARSYRDLLIRLGMHPDGGGNVYSLRKKVAAWDLDDSHFSGKAWLKGSHHNFAKKPRLEDVLIEGSTYSRGALKKRLLKEGLLKNVCAECGCPPEWRGKKLVLILDHRNGIRDDNRLGNLRLLCPNCNSQQPTF